MALKAGYVGVKRWLYEKLQKTTAKNVTDIVGLQDNVVKTGSKNHMIPFTGSYEVNSVTFTAASNGVVTCSGTASATATWRRNVTIPAGSYILSGGPGISTLTSGVDPVFIGIYNTSTAQYIAADEGTTDHYTFENDVTYAIGLRIAKDIVSSNYTFYPMLRLATDPDATYAPYAKTNQQLTADIAADAATLDNHKTTINGIISAATDAADFAAFKTAMAALTPLTRSAAPDTREASPEVEEDPEPVTRKSTKKTTIKEGE